LPLVLSTDVGNEIDDQWAIVYLLTNPAFDVRGLMSAHAPSIRPPAGHTSYLILREIVEQRLGMVTHPPVVEGASEPLADVHTPRKSPAVDFLIQVSKDFDAQHRLNVLTIGAVTDLASAIIQNPGIANRIQVIDMGFRNWPAGGDEFNIANDVRAMQVVLDSGVPLVVGSAEVCQAGLAVSYEEARQMVGTRGPIGRWLWDEYQAWYYRFLKPIRKDDFSKPWVIWDSITLAYLLGQTNQAVYARPHLKDDMSFEAGKDDRKITWITAIDTKSFWAGFLDKLDAYEMTHSLTPEVLPAHTGFLLP
jgi:inosine-uridine nucleoside N-ribohydrolase